MIIKMRVKQGIIDVVRRQYQIPLFSTERNRLETLVRIRGIDQWA